MYARSTTVRGNPQAMDEEITYVRDEVMPALERMSGCVGLSMLADRTSGTCIITSAWADESAMHATEQSVREFRERASQIMDGAHESQAWEIAIMHRAHTGHDGACTRVLWTEGDRAAMDDDVGTARMALLPRMEELPGFSSVSLLIDRRSGRGAMAVTYDSRADMEAARDQGRALREEFERSSRTHTTDIAEFDLVLHHLRVPETV